MRIYGFGAKLSAFMDEAEDDVLAYMSFSADHWPKIHSTNRLECLNGAVKRRSGREPRLGIRRLGRCLRFRGIPGRHRLGRSCLRSCGREAGGTSCYATLRRLTFQTH